jgi:uncharacterized damage-inducible protein DinB
LCAKEKNMLPILQDYEERLQALYASLFETIEGLSPAALEWAPGPDTNSLAVLAVHVAGATRFWIGDMAGRDPSARHRAAEFHARGLDAAALKSRLAETLEHSRRVLGGLALSDLTETRVSSPAERDASSRDERRYTVAWCLAHALEHTALHLGHMQLTRQLWEQTESGVPD